MSNSARAPLPPEMPEIPARSLMLGLAGLLFITVLGFVSATQALNSTSADYGYDEALATRTSSLSSVSFLSNCSGDGPTIAGPPKDSSEKLVASAIVAHGAGSSTANLHARTTGADHVD